MIVAKMSAVDMTPEMKNAADAIWAAGNEVVFAVEGWQKFDAWFAGKCEVMTCKKGRGPSDVERVYLARLRAGLDFDQDEDMPHSGIFGFQKAAYRKAMEKMGAV